MRTWRILFTKSLGATVPNISALKLSMVSPSTGNDDDSRIRPWIVIIQAADMAVEVADPSLTIINFGFLNISSRNWSEGKFREMLPTIRLSILLNRAEMGRCWGDILEVKVCIGTDMREGGVFGST